MYVSGYDYMNTLGIMVSPSSRQTTTTLAFAFIDYAFRFIFMKCILSEGVIWQEVEWRVREEKKYVQFFLIYACSDIFVVLITDAVIKFFFQGKRDRSYTDNAVEAWPQQLFEHCASTHIFIITYTSHIRILMLLCKKTRYCYIFFFIIFHSTLWINIFILGYVYYSSLDWQI